MTSDKQSGFTIGVDIGGTHITAAAVDARSGVIHPASRVTVKVDAGADAGKVLDAWSGAIGRAISEAGSAAGVGLAMPGPFDYERGIALIRGLGKYDCLYGMNIRHELKQRLSLNEATPVIFRNDAICFLLGEAWKGAVADSRRIIGITLGTGFGSAFLRDDAIADSGAGVPPDGFLYHVPHQGKTAEDHFSGRGILALHREMTGNDEQSVEALARRAATDDSAARTFSEFGTRLGAFLAPWAAAFGAQAVVVGGSIARSWQLFQSTLARSINFGGNGVSVRQAALFEDAGILGAARLPLQLHEPR